MDTLTLDLRLAVRALLRRKGYTLLALLTLTIGVGVNTAMFSLVNSLLLKAMPGVERPEELVEISRRVGAEFMDVSYPVLAAMRERKDILRDVAGFTFVPVSVATGDTPRVQLGLSVSGNYFDVLGAHPRIGRFFADEDPRRGVVGPQVVISHRIWTVHYASDPGIVGRTLRVNGVPLEIIGVTAPDFRGHSVGIAPDLYIPLGARVPGMEGTESLRDARSSALQAIGRLQPGMPRAQAVAALSTVAEAVVAPARTVASDRPYEMRVDAYSPVPAVVRGGVVAFLSVLLVISTILLTLTCANVAALVMARAAERGTEIAVRQSLGATRLRLVRLMLTEALVLFLVAGVTGAFIASVTTPLLLRLKPPLPPGFSIDLDLGADWRVMLYAALVATITGIAFSLAPLLRATRPDLASALRAQASTAGRTRARLRSVLSAVQMAATVLLLVVAGLFVRALDSLQTFDTGWDATGVQTTTLDLDLIGADEAGGRALYDELLRRVGAVPGVESVALAGKLPFAGRSSFGPARAEGEGSGAGMPAYFNRVSPGYFRTMGVALLRGRDVGPTDGPDAVRVAVINREMAERLWPGANPIGRRFTVGVAPGERTYETIGVVENAAYGRLGESGAGYYFIPLRQLHNAGMILHVRSAPALVADVSDRVGRAITELAPALPIEAPRPMDEALAVSFLPQRLAAWVSGVVGLFGLLIGTVGIYGMISVMIAQRRRELGIRVALGARVGDVVRLLMRQSLAAPVVGGCVGAVLAVAAGQALGRFLGTVSPVDPMTWIAVAAAWVSAIGLATMVPALRAGRADPAGALRE